MCQRSYLDDTLNPANHRLRFNRKLTVGKIRAKFSPDKTVQNVYLTETVVRSTLCSDDARVAAMAAEKIILCVLFEEFSEPYEICINTCLILQNMLNVTVTE